MWLLTRLAVFFYLAIILSVGVLCILFVAHQLRLEDVISVLTQVYQDQQLSMLLCIIVAVIMFMSVLWANLIYARRQKERTIAFDNPSGPVIVSLNAMEDLMRRLAVRVTEIKEIRPTITANKKGLDVEIRLILRTDVNIPEMTGRLQEMIRSKIQDVIGLEGKINIRIHVVKIVMDDPKYRRDKGGKEGIDVEPTPNVPFRGYRA
jgi:uncharacterized alkaline shock family protein YloU